VYKNSPAWPIREDQTPEKVSNKDPIVAANKGRVFNEVPVGPGKCNAHSCYSYKLTVVPSSLQILDKKFFQRLRMIRLETVSMFRVKNNHRLAKKKALEL
jgi:hypothetical protein